MGRKRVVMNRYKLGRKVGTTESRKNSFMNYLISFTVTFVVIFFLMNFLTNMKILMISIIAFATSCLISYGVNKAKSNFEKDFNEIDVRIDKK
jgi:hypothetical protein